MLDERGGRRPQAGPWICYREADGWVRRSRRGSGSDRSPHVSAGTGPGGVTTSPDRTCQSLADNDVGIIWGGRQASRLPMCLDEELGKEETGRFRKQKGLLIWLKTSAGNHQPSEITPWVLITYFPRKYVSFAAKCCGVLILRSDLRCVCASIINGILYKKSEDTWWI